MVARGFLGIYLDVLAMARRLSIHTMIVGRVTARMIAAFVMAQAKRTRIMAGSLLSLHGPMLQFSTAVVQVHASARCRERIDEHKPYGEHFYQDRAKLSKNPAGFKVRAGFCVLFHDLCILDVVI